MVSSRFFHFIFQRFQEQPWISSLQVVLCYNIFTEATVLVFLLMKHEPLFWIFLQRCSSGFVCWSLIEWSENIQYKHCGSDRRKNSKSITESTAVNLRRSSCSSSVSLERWAGVLCSHCGEDVEEQHRVGLGAGQGDYFFFVIPWVQLKSSTILL